MWKNEIIWLISKREMLKWLQNCVILPEEGAVWDALGRNLKKGLHYGLWKNPVSNVWKIIAFGQALSEEYAID